MESRLELNTRIDLRGKLIVAAPDWADQQFRLSVILVLHHEDELACGVMLNRMVESAESGLQQVLPDEAKAAAVYVGGMDSGPVVAVHAYPELSEFSPAEGIYFATDAKNLQLVLSGAAGSTQAAGPTGVGIVGQDAGKSGAGKSGAGKSGAGKSGAGKSGAGISRGAAADAKVIVGQTRWQAGELDRQIAAGRWLPLPASPGLVFEAADAIWERAMRCVGDHYVALISGCRSLPSSSLDN